MRQIQKLRNKPKAVRIQFAFITACAVTAVVGALWSVTLPMRLAAIPINGTDAPEDTSISITDYFNQTGRNLGQLIGAGEGENDPAASEDAAPVSETGTYRSGVPNDRPDTYNGFNLSDDEPAVEATRQRAVMIATSSEQAR